MTAQDIGTDDELADYVGEAIHTAFRKATDTPAASAIWKEIGELAPSEWNAVTGFVADALRGRYGPPAT